MQSGVAPGIFQQGADYSDEDYYYGTVSAKNLRKIVFHLLMGASMF